MPDKGKCAARARVMCPFYRDHCGERGNYYVKCEGLYTGCLGRLYFRRRADQERFMERYCMAAYGECKYARLLYEKYGE